jgi:oxalate---CoA ligase
MTKAEVVDGVEQLRSEILRICSRLLESTDLTVDDDFFDKGGDSLLATELMLELRQLTGKALPDSLLFESSTVRSLAQRLSEKESPQPKMAVRVGAVSDDAMPVLFFHGDWTRGGFYVEHLARKLGSGISLIAVAPHGPGGEPIPPTIEAMAADRLAAVLEAQPAGPYRLAGHCLGGIVAFETARLLKNLNHQVETVIMIDSPVLVDGEVQVAPKGEWRDLDPTSEDIPVRPLTPEFDWGLEPYSERLAVYSPTPLSVRLLVIAGELDGRGWARQSDDATLQETHTGHFDLVTIRIDELAGRMRSWLTGDGSFDVSERRAFPSVGKDEPSRVGSSSEETPPLAVGETKEKSLSHRLRRFLNYARG